jgi:signal transduction histidine kinase
VEPEVGKMLHSDSALTNKAIQAMQEAVTNAVRHSAAKRIVFNFEVQDSKILMQARNDVTGATKEFTSGLGWLSMQSEAEALHFEQSENEFVLRVAWKI